MQLAVRTVPHSYLRKQKNSDKHEKQAERISAKEVPPACFILLWNENAISRHLQPSLKMLKIPSLYLNKLNYIAKLRYFCLIFPQKNISVAL